jgi:hypothetical protein
MSNLYAQAAIIANDAGYKGAKAIASSKISAQRKNTQKIHARLAGFASIILLS